MLMMVFCLKAALVPLHWWLPTAYCRGEPALGGDVHDHDQGRRLFAAAGRARSSSAAEAGALAGLAQPWILPAALLTIAAGAVGALAGRTLASLVCFSTVWSMGSLLVALGLFDEPGARGRALLHPAQHPRAGPPCSC